MLLAVADRERALRYYRFLYGEGLETRDPEVAERVWFNLARNTRIGIEPSAAGAPPRFVRFGIKVAPFDSAAVAPALRAAGAVVLTAAPSLIRFRDNYGITLDEKHTKAEKARWPCYCGKKSCRGTLLQPKH